MHLRYLHARPEQCLQSGTTHRPAPGEIPHLPSWKPSHLPIKRPRKVECTTLTGITESGFRPLWRQPSSTHQGAGQCYADLPCPWPPEAHPYWTEDSICPAAHLVPEILPCKMLMAPLSTVLFPRPAGWDSGTWVRYSQLSCVILVLIVSEWLVLLLGYYGFGVNLH